MLNLPDPISLIALLVVLALVPFVAIMVTCFVKIVVVLSLLRNALGVQQIPPNMALYGLTIILTLFIMAPVGNAIHHQLEARRIDFKDTGGLLTAIGEAQQPLHEFLLRHTDIDEREFFVSTARELWPESMAQTLTDESLLIVIPAFTVTELTRAFEIGFLLYLPFIVIDLVVSNILLAMGMMMVSPVTISLPFKLFLFVVVDGWARLLHGIVLSYR